MQTNKQKEDQQKSGHGEEEAYSRIYPLTNLNWAPHAGSGHLCSLPQRLLKIILLLCCREKKNGRKGKMK